MSSDINGTKRSRGVGSGVENERKQRGGGKGSVREKRWGRKLEKDEGGKEGTEA